MLSLQNLQSKLLPDQIVAQSEWVVPEGYQGIRNITKKREEILKKLDEVRARIEELDKASLAKLEQMQPVQNR